MSAIAGIPAGTVLVGILDFVLDGYVSPPGPAVVVTALDPVAGEWSVQNGPVPGQSAAAQAAYAAAEACFAQQCYLQVYEDYPGPVDDGSYFWEPIYTYPGVNLDGHGAHLIGAYEGQFVTALVGPEAVFATNTLNQALVAYAKRLAGVIPNF